MCNLNNMISTSGEFPVLQFCIKYNVNNENYNISKLLRNLYQFTFPNKPYIMIETIETY